MQRPNMQATCIILSSALVCILIACAVLVGSGSFLLSDDIKMKFTQLFARDTPPPAIAAEPPPRPITPTRTPTPCTPSISSFTASPPSITAGQSATLNWGLIVADSVEIAPGIGRVTTPGSTTVAPSSTTTYTMTARCGTNIATSSAAIAVTQPPTYNLIARHNKGCLGVSGTTVALVNCGGSSQIWSFREPKADGTFEIEVRNTDNCLSGLGDQENIPFIVQKCSGNSQQLWEKRPSGGYFQLAKNQTGWCVDAKQFQAPIIQWYCKPYKEDDQLDNQLFCQTTSAIAACAPPAGVYVTNIQSQSPFSMPDTPNRFHVFFDVTFVNTMGSPQSPRWFVRTVGSNGGQTPEQALTIPSGTPTIRVGPWNIGRNCDTFTAKVIWKRPSDNFELTFRDTNGHEYSLSFRPFAC